MRKLAIIGAAVLIGFAVSVLAAGDLGGEVVKLTTSGDGGRAFETSLWIVEDHGQLWLRAGQPESAWFLRLQQDPMVRMSRDGKSQQYRAVVVEKQRARINRLMAEQYGWADQLIGLVRDSDTTSAIRLDPVR
jgi:hypothetical protein